MTPADLQSLTQRPECPDDLPLLFELYSSYRQEEMDAIGWPPEVRAAFLKMQFEAQRRGYADMFPKGEFNILLLNGREAGRIVVNRTTDEIRLVDVVLLLEFRNGGIGTRLISVLTHEAAVVRKPLRLHVVQGTRVARLYERLGFRVIHNTGIHDEMEWCASQNA